MKKHIWVITGLVPALVYLGVFVYAVQNYIVGSPLLGFAPLYSECAIQTGEGIMFGSCPFSLEIMNVLDLGLYGFFLYFVSGAALGFLYTKFRKS